MYGAFTEAGRYCLDERVAGFSGAVANYGFSPVSWSMGDSRFEPSSGFTRELGGKAPQVELAVPQTVRVWGG